MNIRKSLLCFVLVVFSVIAINWTETPPANAGDLLPSIPEDIPPTLTPEVTPIPIEECSYYQFNFSHGSTHKKGKISIDQTDSSDFSCLTNIISDSIDQAFNRTEEAKKGYSSYSPDSKYYKSGGQMVEKQAQYITFRLWNNLLSEIGLSRATKHYSEAKKYINCTGGYEATNYKGHAGGHQFGGASGDKHPGCAAGSLYLDKECKMLKPNEIENSEPCGSTKFYSEMATPISLVWDENYKNEASHFVEFKLNPYSDKKVWLWRASGSLPLLVHDPKHSGNITSAVQLFGNWTFGGERLASLDKKFNDVQPWENGYKALELLDKNKDNKISGAELNELALWFDYNQDGVSQVEEVKKLKDLGITTIYFNGYEKQENSLVLNRGYDRVVNGKTISMGSIDWSERGFNDNLNLIMNDVNSPDKIREISQKIENDYSGESSHGKSNNDINGVWEWSVDKPVKGGGYLVFEPAESGFFGTSISELKASDKESNSFSKIMFSHFSGGYETDLDTGENRVVFKTYSAEGAKLKTTATLSKDKLTLIGKTKVTGSSIAESGSFEYDWRATKVIKNKH